jgi:hypothetical protein
MFVDNRRASIQMLYTDQTSQAARAGKLAHPKERNPQPPA